MCIKDEVNRTMIEVLDYAKISTSDLRQIINKSPAHIARLRTSQAEWSLKDIEQIGLQIGLTGGEMFVLLGMLTAPEIQTNIIDDLVNGIKKRRETVDEVNLNEKA